MAPEVLVHPCDFFTSDRLKGSPYILKLYLLDHFKHCRSSIAPESRALFEVVMLVKSSNRTVVPSPIIDEACHTPSEME